MAALPASGAVEGEAAGMAEAIAEQAIPVLDADEIAKVVDAEADGTKEEADDYSPGSTQDFIQLGSEIMNKAVVAPDFLLGEQQAQAFTER